MGARYMKRASHMDPMTVRFIPVKDGDVVELGDTGPAIVNNTYSHPIHYLLGFKPGTAGKPQGWIVVLVDETAPNASKPIKRRTRLAVA